MNIPDACSFTMKTLKPCSFCERCVNKPNPVSYKTPMKLLFSIEFMNTNENIYQEKASQLELIEFMNKANTQPEIVLYYSRVLINLNFYQIEKWHKQYFFVGFIYNQHITRTIRDKVMKVLLTVLLFCITMINIPMRNSGKPKLEAVLILRMFYDKTNYKPFSFFYLKSWIILIMAWKQNQGKKGNSLPKASSY